MNDYVAALRYLYSFMNFEVKPQAMLAPEARNLDHFRRYLDVLGNPQRRFPSVIVAGTNGKGSVARIMASALAKGGLRVGCFTSPHLGTIRERFTLDGAPIDGATFVRLVGRLKQAQEQMVLKVPPSRDLTGFRTTFELMTALAFLAFAEAEVDIAVLEVGLGGRLDTTNVVEPILSVITSISYDHMEILGRTLDRIAREKAGVMRPGVPAIIAPQQPEAAATLAAEVRRIGARQTLVYETPRHLSASHPTRQRFHYDGRSWEMGLLGPHQRENGAVAIEALRRLEHPRWTADDAVIAAGLAATTWPARFQLLPETIGGARIVIDGVHNVGGAQAFARTREEVFGPEPICFVTSFSTGKEPFKIMEILRRPGDGWVHYLSRQARALKRSWYTDHLPAGETLPPMFEDLAAWQEHLPPGPNGGPWPVVCFCGSLIFAGDVLSHLGLVEGDPKM